MNDFSAIILVWLAFFGGAIAGVVATLGLMDRRELERDRGQNIDKNIDKNIAERISKDFFKGMR